MLHGPLESLTPVHLNRPFVSLLSMLDKGFNSVERLVDILYRIGIRTTDKAFAALAERSSRHNSYFFFIQQRLAERIGVHPRALHAGEGVKGALRHKAGEAHVIEAFYHYVPAPVVFLTHHLNIAVAVF